MIQVKIYYHRIEDSSVKAWAYIRQEGTAGSMPIGPSHFSETSFLAMKERYKEFEWEDLHPHIEKKDKGVTET